jgi:DNA-binding NtrC family response regulator
VCASNLPVAELRERLDADLFDRLSHLSITVPPLRECREDLKDDWGRVWRELRQRDDLPHEAPWSTEIERVLHRHALPGNLRDLQRLAVLTMAWWSEIDPSGGLRSALREWERWSAAPIASNGHFGEGTRTERIRWFRQRLAQWAKEQHGTWAAAAAALGCDEKTLRQDAPEGDGG